ncbi:MAG TPA: hypothetical protein VHL09_11310, partial [Dehalococcoidia bacterium]|nr:hypothetical protein [Dehalococcoidia bacterium]
MTLSGSADHLAEDLNRYSPAVSRAYSAAGATLRPRLGEAELREWADAGLRIARNAFRTWESAIEYFQASPAVLDRLGFAKTMRWAAFGRDLSNDSAVIASAYFRASPGVLRHLAAGQVEEWGWIGRNLYQGNWKSGELAARFYEASPGLLETLGARELGYLARLC